MVEGSTTEGILDLAFRNTYTMAPLIQNNIFSRIDMNSGRPETNHVIIDGYIVEIHLDSPTGPLYRLRDPMADRDFRNPFAVYQSMVVPAGTGAPSFAATFFEAIPQVVGESLYEELCRPTREGGRGGIEPISPTEACVPRYNTNVLQRLILSVSAFGRTGGNVPVLTPKFNYPVTVCCGCLRNFPVALAGGMVDAGPGVVQNPTCVRDVMAMTPAVCPNFFGQDFPVPCGLCADTLPRVCEPTGHSFREGVVCPR
jgi:hypothetical protein